MNKDTIKKGLFSSAISTLFMTLFLMVMLCISDKGLPNKFIEAVECFSMIFAFIMTSNFISLFVFHVKTLNINVDNGIIKIAGFGITFAIIATPFLNSHHSNLGYAIIASTFLAVIGYVLFVKDKD